MLARVHSCSVLGIEGIPLTVEVDNHPGLNKLTMVGLPDLAVKESQERVHSAIKNSGFRPPRGITVINLAPADIRKEGSALDLPIAAGILTATDQNNGNRIAEYALAGELALDGSVRAVSGALPMALAARALGLRGIVLPAMNAEEAGIVPGIEVIPVNNLIEAADFLSGRTEITPHVTDVEAAYHEAAAHMPDLSDVKGQAHVKRALTVAAAGGHNLLLVGPPGTGKMMLASRMPGILPSMTFDEALETTRVYSVANSLSGGRRLVVRRPFRAPHHTATTVAICGGGHGVRPMPGEVSMAHNGILFLDELPEFNRAALEAMRQPLEEGMVHIRRAMYSTSFPSRFLLVCALNPCPCGYRGDPRRTCSCSRGDIQRYMSKLSGPLLDRIDIHIEVPAVSFDELSNHSTSGPGTAEVREQVQLARDRQHARYEGRFKCNAHLDAKATRKACRLTAEAQKLLEMAMERMGLSARAYDKLLRVSRTIADLEPSDEVNESHVAEAVQYRSLDRLLE